MYEWVGFDHLPALLEQLAQDETNGAHRPARTVQRASRRREILTAAGSRRALPQSAR